MEEEKLENVENNSAEEKKEKKCDCNTEGFWKASKGFLLIVVIMFLMLASFALGEICGALIRKPDNNEPVRVENPVEGRYDANGR